MTKFPQHRIFLTLALLILLLAPLPYALTYGADGQAIGLPLQSIRLIAILMLAWVLPGGLLVAHWRLPPLNLITQLVIASGLGVCWLILIMLFVHWLPGSISMWQLIGAYELGALALLVALRWHPSAKEQPSVDGYLDLDTRLPKAPALLWAIMLFLLLLVTPLRLWGLDYHEFHFDEVLVLTRAREAIKGDDDAFARHAKGPGELAIGTVVYRALGSASEGTARLPFALASVLSVLATALLAWRLFPTSLAIPFWAGVLLAVNGFALGLSRIVQYQAIILLLSALAVLAAYEFTQQGHHRWLALTGVFSAFGLIMHYEFGLLAPALLLLAWQGWQKSPDKRLILRTLLLIGIPCALLVAAAYIPILTHPYYEKTQSYLDSRMGTFGIFNGPFFVEMGTFYNSSYFFLRLITLVIVGLIIGWRKERFPTLLLTLWFMPFFILYLFIVRFPGTHFYLMMESWSLIGALPLAKLTPKMEQNAEGTKRGNLFRVLALMIVIIWLVVSVAYLYITFLRQDPEYVVNYAETRLPFYWAPYGKEIPQQPRFGFPIFEGWKTLGVLTEWHYLEGSYTSNERSRHLRWYLGGFERKERFETPDFIFIAKHLQQPDFSYQEEWLTDYVQIGEIRVRGEARIWLYARSPSAAPYVVYDAEQFSPIFDGLVQSLEEWAEPAMQIEKISLGNTITLDSAGFSKSTLKAGDSLHLLLKWRPQQPLAHNYKLFVHIGNSKSGQPLLQWDGYPGLNSAHTSQWAVDKVFNDHILLTIPQEMPKGTHSISVGLYDETTGERLGGEAIVVGTIRVR